MLKFFSKANPAKQSIRKTDMIEYCVICGKETEYTRETPIDKRIGYVDGAGQLCRKCYMDTYQYKHNL